MLELPIIGENNIEIIVTSESGLENIINILVTRRDGYYIENIKITNNKIREVRGKERLEEIMEVIL